MKIRQDFVTNSSSSSYLCIAKVDLNDELRAYMKEEFGKFGMRLLAEQLEKGSDIKKNEYSEIREHLEDGELEDGAYYLAASFIEWTNEGDTEGDDAFLYQNIPDEYMKEIYNGGE